MTESLLQAGENASIKARRRESMSVNKNRFFVCLTVLLAKGCVTGSGEHTETRKLDFQRALNAEIKEQWGPLKVSEQRKQLE